VIVLADIAPVAVAVSERLAVPSAAAAVDWATVVLGPAVHPVVPDSRLAWLVDSRLPATFTAGAVVPPFTHPVAEPARRPTMST
jgi:hypothetical protein